MHSGLAFRNFQRAQINKFYCLLKCCRKQKQKVKGIRKIEYAPETIDESKNLNRLSLKKIWRYCFTKNSRSVYRKRSILKFN